MKLKHIALLLISLTALSNCVKNNGKEEKEIEDYEAKIFVKSIFNSIYYWKDEAPKDVPLEDNDLFEYYGLSLYSGDRWSWMTTYEEWIHSETGVYTSYGASLSQPIEYFGDYSIKVRFVYPNSPLAGNGVTRGWTLTHLNGKPVMDLVKDNTFNDVYSQPKNEFTFLDNSGSPHTFTVTSASFSTKSYICENIFTAEDYPGLEKPVGYFNYLTFNKNMLTDISSVMEKFKNEGVGDVIIDLRYNGGGNTNALETLADYLAPSSAEGEVLSVLKHNDNYSSYNSSTKIKRNKNALNLSRLFFITGAGSASASEVLINGMKPLFGNANIIQVGDTTYGKPNGMYVFPYPEGPDDDYYGDAEYIFYPICFFTTNKAGEFIDVNGMLPTDYRPDDLYHDWGVEEDLTKACLYYIVNGSYPELPVISKARSLFDAGSSVITKEEDSPHWGIYSVEYLRP